MGTRYAVLISGDLAENGFPEFFFDVVLMRQTLIDAGFVANNIFILYGDGADYSSAIYPANRYRPNPAITTAAANISDVEDIFDDLANGTNGRPQLTDEDLLFVWTFDHGSQTTVAGSSISTLCLRDGDMRADDFATAVDQVPCAFRIFCMQQCFSGGFIPHLNTDHSVILTAATDSEIAFPSDDVAEEETIGGTVYPHGEFNFYLLAALNGQDLLGNAVNADTNNNGFVTMREAFDFIVANESGPSTPQYDDGACNIGERLHLAFADLFMRDNLSDTGVEPSPGGGLSLSPDIHHFRNELLDPAATLIDGGAMSNGTLFEDIEIGQPNQIYVRAQNRGYSASGAEIDIYWTLPSTLPNPASWTLIGTIPMPSIAPGRHGVAGPLEWPADQIPAKGHYCFVGVLGNIQDPPPDLTAVTSINDFYDLIRENNNVVWKNFDVDDMFAGGYSRVKFRVQGWPRKHHRGDLQLELSTLPVGVQAELRLLKRLLIGATTESMTQVDETNRYAKIVARSGYRCAIRNMPLEPSDNTEVVLTLILTDDQPDGVYDMFVRQLINGREMGRVTRRMIIGDHPYTANSRTGEIHRSDCGWVQKMNPVNKKAYSDLARAVGHGYNGCHYCLPKIDTD
jgi:hypothetical protein